MEVSARMAKRIEPVYEDWGQADENVYETDDGVALHGVHRSNQCQGFNCPIHNPSNHRMKDWPTGWLALADGPGYMLRKHPETGVHYLDPDDIDFHARLKKGFI
jgi:hypothetical protein